MTRREMRQAVQDWAARFSSRDQLLSSLIGTMQRLRGWKTDGPGAPEITGPMRELLLRDDALGILFPIIQEPDLQRAYDATATQRRRFTVDEIPAVTQLFTPSWIVRFLLQHTLQKLWTDSRGTIRARDIRILDPACGSMNFGVAAIDLLREMYRAELREGKSPSVAEESGVDESIVRHNLHGWDIDPVSLKLARSAIELKTGRAWDDNILNLTQRDALLGESEEKFDLVVTNPPYLSSRNMPREMLARLKKKYPAAARDAYACFLLRSLELLKPGGRAGLLVMQSFMFTSAFATLREQISSQAAIETIAHLGGGAFDAGNVGTLQTVAITLRKEPDQAKRDEQKILAIRLTDSRNKEVDIASPDRVYSISQKELSRDSRSGWCYWMTGAARRVFQAFPLLGSVAEPRQGLATTDNRRFVRWWWEVTPTHPNAPLQEPNNRWFPYAKSGRHRRWFESPMHRVNWENDGAEIKNAIVTRYPYLNGKWQWVAKNANWYFKRGVTYSYLTSATFSARLLEEGAIFDVAGSCLFPTGPSFDELSLLAILNSSPARQLLEMINPTVNFQVGDLKQLPVPEKVPDELRQLASRAIEITRQMDAHDPTSPTFTKPWPLNSDEVVELERELNVIESQINQGVSALYGFTPQSLSHREDASEDGNSARRPLAPSRSDRDESAREWIWFAVLEMIKSRDPNEPILIDSKLCTAIGQILEAHHVIEVLQRCPSMDKYLATQLGKWQRVRFKKKPVIQIISASTRKILLPYDWADATMLRRLGV